MTVKTLIIDVKELNNRKLSQYKTGKYIRNETSSRSPSKRRSPKSKMPSIFTRIMVRLRSPLTRLLKPKQPVFKTQLEVFESSMIYFIVIGRYLGIFPNITSDQRKKYPILSRGHIIPIIMCLSQLIVAILSFIGLIYTSINVLIIFLLSYYATSFFCSILVIRLATKWHDLINQIKVADLDEYIDPSVNFKCHLATVAIISSAFLHNILSDTSNLAVILDCDSHNNRTFYEQYILTAYDWFFSVPYSVPLGIMLIILNMMATINLTYYQIFIICVSLYLQSILEKIYLKINSINCEFLSASNWRALREDYSRATQLVRSLDELVSGLVLTSFATNLYFVCLQILYVLRLLHDYAQMTTIAFNVYSTIFVTVNFFTVSLTVARVHSSSLKVAPLLYSVPAETYCIEVQRFIEQVQGDPVALTGLNFFYVTKDVILTLICGVGNNSLQPKSQMVGTIVTYELVLLQLN